MDLGNRFQSFREIYVWTSFWILFILLLSYTVCLSHWLRGSFRSGSQGPIGCLYYVRFSVSSVTLMFVSSTSWWCAIKPLSILVYKKQMYVKNILTAVS